MHELDVEWGLSSGGQPHLSGSAPMVYTAKAPGRQVAHLPDSLPDLADPIEFGGQLAGFEDKVGEYWRINHTANRTGSRSARLTSACGLQGRAQQIQGGSPGLRPLPVRSGQPASARFSRSFANSLREPPTDVRLP